MRISKPGLFYPIGTVCEIRGGGPDGVTPAIPAQAIPTFDANGRLIDLQLVDMGAGYIKAVDYDQLAIENCGENFIVNQIKAGHDIVHGSIDSCQTDRVYDFVCANIIKSTILDMLEDLKRLTRPGGYLVLAGLLEQDEMEVSEKLLKLGLDDFEVFDDNEWRTFVVRGTRV